MNMSEIVPSTDVIESVMLAGDLSKLTDAQRIGYYKSVCESMGLNPLTQPFAYIRLNGKLTLYAKRDAADQLRKLHHISIDKPSIEFEDDMVIVSVTGRDKTGRTDSDLGVVSLGRLQGEQRANAILKAITKAKRRLTLSIVGLGWLDETEIETIPGAETIEPKLTTTTEQPPQENGTHWINDDNSRKRFWAWTHELALSHEEVHEALGVDSLKNYTGSKSDAMTAINDWIERQGSAEDDPFADINVEDAPEVEMEA